MNDAPIPTMAWGFPRPSPRASGGARSGSLPPLADGEIEARGTPVHPRRPCNRLSLPLVAPPPARPAVFDFHQAVDGLQEVQRQAQEGKK